MFFSKNISHKINIFVAKYNFFNFAIKSGVGCIVIDNADEVDRIEEIAEENDDIIVGKVNVDENPELCVKYGIVSIPTLIAFKDGEIIAQKMGVTPKQSILEMFK
jgi:hypothetical protein